MASGVELTQTHTVECSLEAPLQSKRRERHMIRIGTAMAHFAGMAQNAARGICARHQRPRSTRHGLGLQFSDAVFIFHHLPSFRFCEDFCCNGSNQRKNCAAFPLRLANPTAELCPPDKFCLCEENPDLKQHENERGAKLSMRSVETVLALTVQRTSRAFGNHTRGKPCFHADSVM